MTFYVPLRELLNIDEDQSGVIREISEEMEISEFALNQLLRGKAKTVAFETLSKVGDYLVKNRLAERSELPMILLACKPHQFLPLLTDRRRFHVCLGKRNVSDSSERYVIAADSELQAELIQRITMGGDGTRATRSKKTLRDTLRIKMHQVPAPEINANHTGAIRKESKHVYDEFKRQKHNNKALICLGSVKSNPVIEFVVARCFPRARPFSTQDEVEHAKHRACPFTFIYRDEDPHPESICGGLRLSKNSTGNEPGIYYEQPGGAWACCPWHKDSSDAGLVFYRYQKSLRNLEMFFGGFSARGTRSLIDLLKENKTDELWPPVYQGHEVDIGIFVVEFRFDGAPRMSKSGLAQFQKPTSTKIIRLSEEVIKRRLKRRKRTVGSKTVKR